MANVMFFSYFWTISLSSLQAVLLPLLMVFFLARRFEADGDVEEAFR